MWESGIRFCYEERSSYLGYVPLISLRTWHAMSEPDQQRITAVWESIVDDSRLLAQRRQQSAREELEQNGIEIFSDVEALSAARRGELFDRSVLLAKELGMDMSLVSAAADVLDAMRPDGVA